MHVNCFLENLFIFHSEKQTTWGFDEDQHTVGKLCLLILVLKSNQSKWNEKKNWCGLTIIMMVDRPFWVIWPICSWYAFQWAWGKKTAQFWQIWWLRLITNYLFLHIVKSRMQVDSSIATLTISFGQWPLANRQNSSSMHRLWCFIIHLQFNYI